VKKCIEITELLSVYVDNELNDTDKQSVEEHLAECESCSALLEIYREISISADESNVQVPDALRLGVMNRVQSEEISAEEETEKKKWWQHQVLLTRVAPIAACLVVVLLVWQFSGNLFGMNDSSSPAAAPAPMADTSVPGVSVDAPQAEPAPAPLPETDNDWNDDAGQWGEAEMTLSETTDGVQSQGSSAPDTNPAATPGTAPGNRAGDESTGTGQASTPGTNQPGGNTGGDQTSTPGTNQPGGNTGGGQTSTPGTNQPGTNQPGTSQPGTNQPGTNPPGGNTDGEFSIEEINELTKNAFVEVAITGGALPTFLNRFEPLTVEDGFEWELVYEITRDDLNGLMAEIVNRPGISFARPFDNRNNTYVMVLFKSE